MKVVSLILSALLASAYGLSVCQSDIDEIDLESSANTLLKEIKPLMDEIEAINIVEQKRKITLKISDYTSEFDKLLRKNSRVLEIQESLREYSSNGKNVKDCEVNLEEALFWASRSLDRLFSQRVRRELNEMQSSLTYNSLVLTKAKEALENNLAEIIEKCNADILKCRITGKFSIEVDDAVEIISSTKSILANLIESSMEKIIRYIPSEVSRRLWEEQVEECLKKMN